MGIADIREIIDRAHRHEAEHHVLRDRLIAQLPELRLRLELPDASPIDALLEFTARYVNYVPDFLEQLSQGADADATALLHMAEDFFLAPPDALNGEEGLCALLDEAFLAQRFIEELNDRHHALDPPVQVDMTRANIIVHYLIGEPMATRLEMLVTNSLALASRQADSFSGEPAPGAAASLPCMSREVGVDLRLPEPQSPESAGGLGDG